MEGGNRIPGEKPSGQSENQQQARPTYGAKQELNQCHIGGTGGIGERSHPTHPVHQRERRREVGWKGREEVGRTETTTRASIAGFIFTINVRHFRRGT